MANEEEDRAYMSSCCSEGVEYRLHDIVKIFDKRYSAPHIGKILKMWESRSSGVRKALVCWFLWHKEVKPDDADNPKELFLAFGKDKGATNELNMDSIVGKCKVVCISSDPRNKEPSVSDVENADFMFSHAYDVDLKHTFPVEVVADKLGPDVIFNTEEWLIAITKIEGKTNEFNTKQSIKSSPSESKKRPRDAEVVSNLQKREIDKQDDPKKGRVSSEEAIKKKRVKASDGKEPVTKEKAREGYDSKQEEMVQSKQQTLKSEAVSRLSKTQTADVKEPASTEGADVDKASTPRKMVDIIEQTDSIIKGIVRQVDDEVKSKGEDSQKLENRARNSLKKERAQAEGREEADHEAPISDGEKFDSKKPLLESDISLKEDPNIDSIFKLLKKPKSSLIVEPEKRPTSAAEPVKAFERRRFFKEPPWEQNLQRGIPQGKVLHLQNIDPHITSTDMREMLRSAFQGFSDARVLPKDSTCPTAQAIAIFESRLQAESALEAIETDCLVLADQKWPVIASRVKESVNQVKYPGHLALDKFKLGRSLASEGYKKAVSTSHSSQPNTIEFELAMEWRQLQEVTRNCRMELFKKQRRELNDLRNRGNSKAQRSKQDSV